jgi:hypothetical protein
MIDIDLARNSFWETLIQNRVTLTLFISFSIVAVVGLIMALISAAKEYTEWEEAEKGEDKDNSDFEMPVSSAPGMLLFLISILVLMFNFLYAYSQSSPLNSNTTLNELRTKLADTYGVEFSDRDLDTLKSGVELKYYSDTTNSPNSYVDSKETVSALSDDYTTIHEYKLRFIGTDKVQLLEKSGSVDKEDFTPVKVTSK